MKPPFLFHINALPPPFLPIPEQIYSQYSSSFKRLKPRTKARFRQSRITCAQGNATSSRALEHELSKPDRHFSRLIALNVSKPRSNARRGKEKEAENEVLT